MAQHSNLIYALRAGCITSISDVASGLKCGCVCPACGAALVARKGTKRMHHFAHYASENCEYGYETSLHLAAKDILSRIKRIAIPAVYVEFPESGKEKVTVSQEMEIPIDHVELERTFENITPDVVVYSGKQFFFIEVFVTHAIDEEKLRKLKERKISTIEIDLSHEERNISADELADILIKNNAKKIWKYNAVADKWYNRFLKVVEKKHITVRGMALHVDGCPMEMRNYRGKTYANFIDDCIGCEYCISAEHEGYMLCSGRKKISTIADFKLGQIGPRAKK